MSTKGQKLNTDFLGAMGSGMEQYVKGKLSAIAVIKILEHILPEEDKANWSPKSGFRGHDLIETFLELKGMTQADLAKETGLSTSKINDLIKGRINVTPSTAKKLASVFGVEHTTFL